MKIGQTPELPSTASQTAVANTQKDKGAAALPPSASTTAQTKAASSGVSVSVSSLAKSLGKPEASSAGVIDTAKVASVKTAIKEGTYKVNAEAIADKLLSNAQDMLKPVSR